MQEDQSIVALQLDQLKFPSITLRPVNEKLVVELARSIENTGLLQPIVVRRQNADYEVVFGNHRVEACKRLGMKWINSLIISFTDEDAFLVCISENILKNTHVDPLEEARGYRMLIEKGWTVNSIGKKVGKCDSYISERLALLDNLPRKIRSDVRSGFLTPSHAELLSRIHDADRQSAIAELVKNKKLSVRSLENLLKKTPHPVKTEVCCLPNECTLKIPPQFAEAMGLGMGKGVFMYMQGRKLVIEATRATRGGNSQFEHRNQPYE